eukprot:scaffold4450_cov444-Prasinococcus_capsulatus_cf.AAC.4
MYVAANVYRRSGTRLPHLPFLRGRSHTAMPCACPPQPSSRSSDPPWRTASGSGGSVAVWAGLHGGWASLSMSLGGAKTVAEPPPRPTEREAVRPDGPTDSPTKRLRTRIGLNPRVPGPAQAVRQRRTRYMSD